ncbi:MAG: DivIVA domain-containing protein [Actinomycetota bacterium]
MPLTPQDIVRKEFREAFRGYSQTDVDLFLDEVVDEITRLIDDNQKMRVRLAALQQELARYRDARTARADEQMASRYGADDAGAQQQPSTQQRRPPLPSMPKPEDPFGPTSERPSRPPPSGSGGRGTRERTGEGSVPQTPARPSQGSDPLLERDTPPRPHDDPASTQPHRPSSGEGDRWRPPAGSERPFWGGD